MKLTIVAALLVLTIGVFGAPRTAEAQQPGKVPRIGILAFTPPSGANLDAFRRGLRELGYIEGQNIILEVRSAEGRSEGLPALAAELVQLKVDIIVPATTPAILAAKRATSKIPIVMPFSGDPVGDGLVTSLAHPGGNITGLSNLSKELNGKRLELLKDVIPGLSRVAVLWNTANPLMLSRFRDTEVAARALGLQLQSLRVRGPSELESAFHAATGGNAGALFVVLNPLTALYRNRIAELAAKNHLPALHGLREYVEAGGLMSYGANFPDMFRRAATYVDKILKGAKPADLPVEQPTKFELVINLKTAKALGLTIPQSVLIRADEVIQ